MDCNRITYAQRDGVLVSSLDKHFSTEGTVR